MSKVVDVEKPTKSCRHCKNAIHDKATVCTECGKSQNRYLSFLTTIGGLSAAFTIIVGVVTYIASNLPEVIKQITLIHDVAVVKIDINGYAHSVVIENIFDDEVYLEEFIFYFPDKASSVGNYSRSIEQTLAPGESKIIRALLPGVSADSPPPAMDYINPDSLTPEGEKIVEEVALMPFQPRCFTAQFAFPKGQFFDNVVQFHGGWDKVIPIDHELFLRYYAPRTQDWKLLQVESAGTLMRTDEPDCF